MGPYHTFPDLPQSLLNEAFVYARQEDGWESARVYASRASTANDIVDSTVRSAAVMVEGTAQHLYADFEAYIEADVFPSVFRHWGLRSLYLNGTQLIRYEPGGHFKPHRDSSSAFWNRCVTIISYINDDYVGGETFFPGFEERVRPHRGKTIAFLSDTLHAGLPVIEGTKFVLASWALCRPIAEWI